ncbi:flagellin [Polaromonas sp.]|uniref:flagellin N-terminal helical domain-containing protein n=1 Tax=Polaromonas sp. TaxID=1869339 RepID=UPI0013BC216A|nr:flagellin [Polaromonas sp.]NDP63947.1 flagellin FliC [Polaromonas sp.]
MSSVINTNSLSLLTQNNLTKSQASLNTAIQRLSSGMRINSAKDDAAGQAIANRFTANIKGLSQAQRNANDGISLAQTTEGALNEVNTNLQRIRELTVQSANGSNSADDKASIQAEITQRLSEIDRTSAQTDFNGVKVLSSSAKELSVQVGANDGETIKIGLSEISSKTLGLTGFNVDGTGPANKAAGESDLLVAGWAKGATTSGNTVFTKATVAATANDVLGKMQDKGTVVVGTSTYTYAAASKSYTLAETGRTGTALTDSLKAPAGQSLSATVTLGGASTNIKIDSSGGITAADGSALFVDTSDGNLTATKNGTTVAASVTSLTTQMGTVADTIKINNTGTVFTATAVAGTMSVTNEPVAASTVNALVNTFAAPATIDIDGAGGATAAYGVAATGAVTVGAAAQFVDISGAISAGTNETITMHENGIVTDSKANTVFADATSVGKLTTKAVSNATATVDPLKALDAALSQVDKLRGSLGAVQNRFDSVISNLGSTITNLSSSRSRIEDADYATEVSNMTRAQILQQAGTSVLAKANQSTQGVMSLLQ